MARGYQLEDIKKLCKLKIVHKEEDEITNGRAKREKKFLLEMMSVQRRRLTKNKTIRQSMKK